MRRWLLVGFLAVAIVAGGFWAALATGLIFHDTTRPATVEDALRLFRARTTAPQADEGVYVYDTRGTEALDALGGAEHVYPATTTITLTRAGCGSRLRWASLEARSTTWRLCSGASGLELRIADEVHRFFGRTDRTTYLCRASVLLPARVVVGEARAFSCRSGSGRERGTARIVGRETISVGGSRIDTVRVSTVARVSGDDSGTEEVDWWLASELAVPVRMVLRSRTSRKVFVGRVHYSEDVELRLASLDALR